MIKSTKRNRFSLSLMAVAVCMSSVGAYAAGLGKITVLSPLGQPLRAELDVTASREELSSMTARLASPDAFKQVGIEYLPAFAGIRFVLDKRADGQPYLRVSTDRPMNEPFLDILIELTWSSGKMVREYTMLLDPPDVFSKPVPAPVALPESRPTPQKEPAAVAPPEPLKPAAPVSVEKAQPSPAKEVAPVAEKAPGTDTRVVRSGDTLTKIAEETRPEGVSLDQMLVALFRGNQDAFSGKNMNRLKAGKILAIPSSDSVTAASPGEARRTVVAQARDFNAYRKKLAAAVAATPVKEEVARQQDTGRIAPKIEDKVPSVAPSKDKLEVSRTETAKDAKGVQDRISALEEDLVSRDKSLKEASSRVADLEKNLSDLKKLAEMKSQVGVQMQQRAEPPKPAAEVPPPVPAKPAEVAAVKPAEEAKSVEKPAETPVVTLPKADEAIKPKEEAKPAAVKPSVPQPAVERPDFAEENPGLIYGGGGLVALLLGWLGYSSWRRKQQSVSETPPTASRLSEGDLMANSVFGSTGGQSVNTGASIQTDFSQANLTSINADEGVDPVAEADVYMAYGRDAQAEEILLDALKNDPARHAVYLKLLEIYSGRKNLKQFASVAADFHAQTGGAGQDWEKAAELGRALDPTNKLYATGIAAAFSAGASVVTEAAEISVPRSEAEKLHETVILPGQLGQIAAAVESPAVVEPPAALDFELDLAATPESQAPAAMGAVPTMPTALDFNLDLNSATTGSADLSLSEVGQKPVVGSETAATNASGLDFEFDLDVPAASASTAAAGATAAPAFDLSSIDLDLGSPPAPGATGEMAGGEADNPDVATKLELAQAYEEMGDKEGARELLQEVLQEGSTRQQGIARDRLTGLTA